MALANLDRGEQVVKDDVLPGKGPCIEAAADLGVDIVPGESHVTVQPALGSGQFVVVGPPHGLSRRNHGAFSDVVVKPRAVQMNSDLAPGFLA
jgi:hypothetical protein